MKKSYLWRKMTSGLMAAAVTVTAMPGLGLTMVQAEEKKTLKVAMECSYAPYNWTQPDDSNGAVPISGSSDYAYGYDVMMAKKICDELGYDLEIVKLDWDSLVPAVQSGKVTVLSQVSPLPPSASRWWTLQNHTTMHLSLPW